MPFTTKEIVKKHILDHHIGSAKIYDEKIQLNAADSSQLEKRMILADSERVKAREQNDPNEENISFASSNSASLAHNQVIPNTVVAANNSSLSKIYIENIDYQIDYNSGIITRIVSGSIPEDGAVSVWYLNYRVYQRGSDYDMDYQAGTLKRRSGGAIESGQWVLVDYTTEYGNLDDSSIENAISEANDQVLSFIDEAYRESADRLLVTAETYMSVAIICRIRAMESISPSRGKTDGGNESRSWAALSDMYKKEAYNILSKFAGRLGSFKSPASA